MPKPTPAKPARPKSAPKKTGRELLEKDLDKATGGQDGGRPLGGGRLPT